MKDVLIAKIPRFLALFILIFPFGLVGPSHPKVASPFKEPELLYFWYKSGNISVADQILKNRWQVSPRFSYVDLPAPSQLTWTENPLNEQYWRFLFYSLRPLKELSYAYQKTKKSIYMEKLQEILVSFLERGIQSPYIRDKHTAAYLGVSLVYFHKRLEEAGLLNPFIQEKLPVFLKDLSDFLLQAENFEWNNHGITQAMALCLMAINFPALPGAQGIFDQGWERFLRLLNTMVDESGVQIEQSPFYHFYSLKKLWDILMYTKRVPVFKNATFAAKMEKMVDFAAHVVQPSGDVPLISSSVFYNIAEPQNRVIKAIAENYPHFQYALSKGKEGSPPQESSKLFREGGFAVLSSENHWVENYEDKIHIVFDVGPYRTKHSQLDALAVNIYGLGHTLFPDSGLFSYEAGKKKEYYFSSRAHNLAAVGHLSQKAGSATALTFLNGEEGSYQSGYHELYEGFVAKRGVLLLRDHFVVVFDEIIPKVQREGTKSSPNTNFHLYWHLHPQAKVAIRGGQGKNLRRMSINLKNTPVGTLQIMTPGPYKNRMSIVRGKYRPRQGWFSEKYEMEVPNRVIEYSVRGKKLRAVSVMSLDGNKERVFPELKLTWEENRVKLAIRKNHLIKIQNFASQGENLQLNGKQI